MKYLVTKEAFEVKQEDIDEIKSIYEQQCPSIFNQGMNTDNGLLQIIAIGNKMSIDYLQYLVDMYDRDRVRMLRDDSTATYVLCDILQLFRDSDVATK